MFSLALHFAFVFFLSILPSNIKHCSYASANKLYATFRHFIHEMHLCNKIIHSSVLQTKFVPFMWFDIYFVFCFDIFNIFGSLEKVYFEFTIPIFFFVKWKEIKDL